MWRSYRVVVVFAALALNCQPKKEAEAFGFKKRESVKQAKISNMVDLSSKGVGPVQSVILDEKIDDDLALSGQLLYQEKCTACHKIGTTFIGPPPNGILKRRTPEWIMNMILNPDEMIQQDSLAKALFMEFNGQLMTNQGLNEAQARSILEYFRTLE